jgi:transketolase
MTDNQEGPALLARAIRRVILEQSKRANVGHIGSALSIADIVAALYASILKIPAPSDPLRDRFILSKGHAVLAVYAALHMKGWISEEELNTFCGDATLLGVHPEHALTGIEYSTGSLGHGLTIGAGAALAGRLKDEDYRVFVLVSDAECNEGSLWEAVMFAAHHQLSNLVAIVDLNGQQAMGYTREVLDLSPLSERWRAFGWHVQEVDGHDHVMIENSVDAAGTIDRPHVLLARTTFGKGVSFMESLIKWHYLPMTDEDYTAAMKELA